MSQKCFQLHLPVDVNCYYFDLDPVNVNFQREEVSCQNENCNELVCRGAMDGHLANGCQYRTIKCKICSEDYVHVNEEMTFISMKKSDSIKIVLKLRDHKQNKGLGFRTLMIWIMKEILFTCSPLVLEVLH